jgi:integrase
LLDLTLISGRKFPFIHSEQEIDALIAGSNKKHAVYLQLLKETAMRSGEAKRLQWTDIDKAKRVITLNDPEKVQTQECGESAKRLWKC